MSGETTLRRYVARQLKAHGQVSQLESGATAAGIPDTLFFDADSRKDVWIELKHGAPKNRWELRKTQIAWMRRRIHKGGFVFLLLKYSGGEDRYCLILVNDVTKLEFLSHNQNCLSWFSLAEKEWQGRIPDEELVKEIRKCLI